MNQLVLCDESQSVSSIYHLRPDHSRLAIASLDRKFVKLCISLLQSLVSSLTQLA